VPLHVIKPGMLTTVQDLGRWGFQCRGVPVAGPMDAYAHRLANALVGNHQRAATLEITLVGPDLELDEERLIAVTGADFDMTLNGDPRLMQAAFIVARGSRLTFGRRLRGARAYLAIEGGIAVPPVLGSRATHVTTQMGGMEGRTLKAGDRLPIGPAHGPPKGGPHVRTAEGQLSGSRGPYVRTAEGTLPVGRGVRLQADLLKSPARLRVLPGPHLSQFSDDALRILQAAPYTIDQASDRMGFRLAGHPVAVTSGDMISDATPMGTLQILPSGLPMLLMADRQTTGGYPQIATVITADLRIAGQLAAGDRVSLTLCSPADAMAALIAQERTLLNIERQESA
jgi:antagonist of KipI